MLIPSVWRTSRITCGQSTTSAVRSYFLADTNVCVFKLRSRFTTGRALRLAKYGPKFMPSTYRPSNVFRWPISCRISLPDGKNGLFLRMCVNFVPALKELSAVRPLKMGVLEVSSAISPTKLGVHVRYTDAPCGTSSEKYVWKKNHRAIIHGSN